VLCSLVQTISILEERLTMNEDRVKLVEGSVQELVRALNPTAASGTSPRVCSCIYAPLYVCIAYAYMHTFERVACVVRRVCVISSQSPSVEVSMPLASRLDALPSLP
jgi:hypothetical protein